MRLFFRLFSARLLFLLLRIDKDQFRSIDHEVGKLFLLCGLLLPKRTLQYLLELQHETFAFSFIKLSQKFLVEGYFVFLLGFLRPIVVLDEGQVLRIGIDEGFEEESAVFLVFEGAGYTGQEDIGLYLLLDENVYDAINIVFEVGDDGFVLFFGQRCLN